MPTTFMMRLDNLQPSQLFISSEKLSRIESRFDPQRLDLLEPIPVKELDGQVILTDGHTRALLAHMSGHTEIPAYWDEDQLDWDAYRICIAWCRGAQISTVADLLDRVLGPEAYQTLWIERCRQMQHGLAQRRRRENGKEKRRRDGS